MVKYQPKPIKTQQDYEQALGIIEGMMSRTLTKDEGRLFELLVLLIKAYEQQYYPMNKTNPTATLESLIHEFDVNHESLTQAESLADFFNHLSPKLAFLHIKMGLLMNQK